MPPLDEHYHRAKMLTNPAWAQTRMLTLSTSSKWTLNRLGRRDWRIVAFQWAATPRSCRAARSRAGSSPSTLMLMLGHSLAPSPPGTASPIRSRLPQDGAENLRHPARSLPGMGASGGRTISEFGAGATGTPSAKTRGR